MEATKDVTLINVLQSNVCGHLFECLEYYFLLRDNGISAKIHLVYDNFTKQDLINALINKYDLTDSELSDTVQDTDITSIDSYFSSSKVKNYLDSKVTVFTEIHDLTKLYKRGVFPLCQNIIGLRCSKNLDDFEQMSNQFKNLEILQDYRLYGNTLFSWDTHNHVKNIMFNKLKKYNFPEKVALLYLSTELREIPKKVLANIISAYTDSFNGIVISSRKKETYSYLESDKITTFVPPIKDFHSKFDTFIYAPLEKRFDCSPRLIPECKHYGKEIILHDLNYIDDGLAIRLKDCDNIQQLNMSNDDLLISRIKKCL